MTAAELSRIANRIVLLCARGHEVVLYGARRDEPPPPCPACGWTPITRKNVDE